MDMTYQVIALALLVGSVVTGFITFRMQGMKLAIHFGAIMLALLATLAAVATGMPALVSAAAVLQVIVAVTAFTQLWETLKYTFQTSPGYGAHMALVTMLPVFAVAAVAL
ncbi:MAG: DUF5400 family protein [Methanofollis sp.]|uniref:DUF5400 family protein n=1 Tax=Methanofollis sp. TaxID=2052835 RepID=UPI00260D11C4|nr:DUF5400 family protein [Methanofollis sp.]MDD4254423.1 DUF5400 family protein [Methanofollis sp.]